MNHRKRLPRLSQTRLDILPTKEPTIKAVAGSQTENCIQLLSFFLQRTASHQRSHTQRSLLLLTHTCTKKILSFVKSTFSILLTLLAVTSAAPQGLVYGSGSDLSYGNGGTSTLCSGPGCLPTQVPVSPITIASETDLLPINNVQPVVNVFPPDINDYSYDYHYNNYGDYGGLGDYGYTGSLGYLSSLSGGSWDTVLGGGGLGSSGMLTSVGGIGGASLDSGTAIAGVTGLSGGPGMLGPLNGLNGANGMLRPVDEQGLIGGGSMPLSSTLGAGGLGALGMGMLDPITALEDAADNSATLTSASGLDMLAAAGSQHRLGPGLDPFLAPDCVDLPLGVIGGDVPAIMGVPAGLGALVGGGLADLGCLSADAPAMVNPGDLGALGTGMPMMAGTADVGGIIAGLQYALRGIATGVRGVA